MKIFSAPLDVHAPLVLFTIHYTGLHVGPQKEMHENAIIVLTPH